MLSARSTPGTGHAVDVDMVYETRRAGETEEERLAERLARSEHPAERARRIARKTVDPAAAAAIRRALGIER